MIFFVRKAHSWISPWSWVVVVGLLLVGVAAGFLVARPVASEAADLEYSAIGTWNGKKIYLSPATHSNSGDRGECGPAWQHENYNGFWASWAAANSVYYKDVLNQTSSGRNLRVRGYNVRIGQDSNSVKISNSNAWGSTLHIPVHSNSYTGWPANPTAAECAGSDPGGTHVLWWSNNGHSLSIYLANWIGRYGPATWGPYESPGTNDRDDCDNKIPLCTSIYGLGELTQTVAVAGYVELEFHSSQDGAAWLKVEHIWAWRFGPAIDGYLGYP